MGNRLDAILMVGPGSLPFGVITPELGYAG
jgi:hypothetical protein